MADYNENLEAMEELFKTGKMKATGSEGASAAETLNPGLKPDSGGVSPDAELSSTPQGAASEPDAKEYTPGDRKKRKKLFIDDGCEETPNYTGDEVSERDYRPVRQSHEYHSGCLGGLMYFVFVCCCAFVLAVFAWMAASDMLALNKESFAVQITLPTTIFHTETETVKDENGNETTREVTYADIDYVADTLQSAGLIEYKWLFSFFCDISHAARKIDAGTYTLKSTFDYRALVTNMQTNSNRTLTVTVTIPEGFTMHDIFLKLEESGVCSYEELMDAAANHAYKYEFLDQDKLGDATRLEGYLFPDTYEFYVGMQASSAINKFLQNFNAKYKDEIKPLAEAKGMSVKDILTIASLIEKEAAVDAAAGVDERTTVSSVIYNRLKADMSLGLESAILYENQDYEGMPTAEMMQKDTPYNLNINKGLPPTPICSPSMDSVYAALNPISSRYYYFMLDNTTNTHRFFTNYNDFLAFIAAQNAG